MSGVSTISSLYSSPPPTQPKPLLQRRCIIPTRNSSVPTTNRSVPPLTFTCNFSSRSPPGENESKNILDAFFLGKSLAEAVTERIESTVGEFLSTVGRLQAEQQKQVQDFQEEVLERAKQAKEKAARETMGTQGLISNSYAADTSTAAAAISSGRVASPRTNRNSQPANIDSGDGSKDSELGVSDAD